MKGITNFGIFYKKGWDESLFACAYSYYAGDLEDRKSISGYVFLLSFGVVAWSSRKKSFVTLSTIGA